MEVILKGAPEEIAALMLEVQRQRGSSIYLDKDVFKLMAEQINQQTRMNLKPTVLV